MVCMVFAFVPQGVRGDGGRPDNEMYGNFRYSGGIRTAAALWCGLNMAEGSCTQLLRILGSEN